ncbi:hypothetical protein DW058_12510 [Clostridiaceae bacterium AF42-6]|nr:hypothetical protein DW058_12510 [Clostridiaceae bacterium AF42-6]
MRTGAIVMNCKQVQRQLVSYINGELEEKEEEEFVKHIRHCRSVMKNWKSIPLFLPVSGSWTAQKKRLITAHWWRIIWKRQRKTQKMNIFCLPTYFCCAL